MQVLAVAAGFTVSCKQRRCENVKGRASERASERVARAEVLTPMYTILEWPVGAATIESFLVWNMAESELGP